MKRSQEHIIHFLFLLLVSIIVYPAYAQDTLLNDNSYITIEGTVRDKQTHKRLEYVHIAVTGSNIGTITNDDGTFSIKVTKSLNKSLLEVSHIGYKNTTISINKSLNEHYKIYLEPTAKTLDDLIVRFGDAYTIVEAALQNIEKNYSADKNKLTGFYRETVQKKRRFINISEAITETYKTSYKRRNTDFDRVQILKGRKILSPKTSDTLIVKLLGGPNLSIYGDVVKNPNLVFDPEIMPYYRFQMGESTMLNNRQHYTIYFYPQAILEYPLFQGILYIDKERLSFSRAEFELNLDDKEKATKMILRKKPFGLHFKPLELSYLVTYQEKEGKYYLNYTRNEIRFKCDWKRKLFSTTYTIVSEVVTTDHQVETEMIPYKVSFKSNHSLSDKVSNFSDEDFWGAYNIIEPTESLEKAVHKLKKQYNQ